MPLPKKTQPPNSAMMYQVRTDVTIGEIETDQAPVPWRRDATQRAVSHLSRPVPTSCLLTTHYTVTTRTNQLLVLAQLHPAGERPSTTTHTHTFATQTHTHTQHQTQHLATIT